MLSGSECTDSKDGRIEPIPDVVQRVRGAVQSTGEQLTKGLRETKLHQHNTGLTDYGSGRSEEGLSGSSGGDNKYNIRELKSWSLWRILEWLGYKLGRGNSYLLTTNGLFKILGKFEIGSNYMVGFYDWDWITVKVVPK